LDQKRNPKTAHSRNSAALKSDIAGVRGIKALSIPRVYSE
jgi:hypothetical protein